MQIDRITFTGADDETDIDAMIELSKAYPLVEWGILVSKSTMGQERFPSEDWIKVLKSKVETNKINLALHLCGRWVRDLGIGNFSVMDDCPFLSGIFQRLQLNFHGWKMNVDESAFVNQLWRGTNYWGVRQYILQFDDVNNSLLNVLHEEGIDVVPLFDTSGGLGVVPSIWPPPLDEIYCGYAGGLGPHNIEEQLVQIENVVGDRGIWIDMETHVRSEGYMTFDLDKVKTCIQASEKYFPK